LPEEACAAIRDKGNSVYLSVVSSWETIVKYQLGKLPLPEPPTTYLKSQRTRHEIASMDLDEDSVARLSLLPNHHRDPFDRMLICQAQEHNLIVVTVDEMFKNYPVRLFEFQ
jgi:PIN domain nuclease of toxin-antitoxin system